MRSFFRHIAKALHWWKYSLANSLLWPRLRKFANKRLEHIAKCLGHPTGLAEVSTTGMSLKECQPFRTCLKWLMKFGAADIHMGEGVPLDEIKAKLPCLKKYYAREKLGVKEDKEGDQKSQALKPPAPQAPNASGEEFLEELDDEEQKILDEAEKSGGNGVRAKRQTDMTAIDDMINTYLVDNLYLSSEEHARFGCGCRSAEFIGEETSYIGIRARYAVRRDLGSNGEQNGTNGPTSGSFARLEMMVAVVW
ncbi:hypothetical protein Ddc_22296 [Ditylenchus destructor]|nr:hypothetical protein Ddc_22296 [Ditylenchus destructor]